MKRTKRICAVFLIALFLLSLAACGDKESSDGTDAARGRKEPPVSSGTQPAAVDSPELFPTDVSLVDSAEDVTQASLADSMEDLE